MVVEFGGHKPVHKGFLELAEQAILAHDRGWVAAGEEFVNQFVADGHGSSPWPYWAGL